VVDIHEELDPTKNKKEHALSKSFVKKNAVLLVLLMFQVCLKKTVCAPSNHWSVLVPHHHDSAPNLLNTLQGLIGRSLRSFHLIPARRIWVYVTDDEHAHVINPSIEESSPGSWLLVIKLQS
jgi:hypothetical protein